MTRNRLFGPVAAGLLVVGTAACATIQATRSQPGKVTGGNFTPGRPQLTEFGANPALACPVGRFNTLLATEVERQAKAAGSSSVPKESGTLCAVADSFLEWPGVDDPSRQVTNFTSEWFGMAVPVKQVNVAVLATDDPQQIAEHIAETIVSFGKTAPTARYGVVTVLLPKSDRFAQVQSRVVLALADDNLAIAPPVPRRLNLGETATLKGTLLGDAADPRVEVSQVDGQVLAPEQKPGKEFTAALPCGSRPGAIRVQITADLAGKRRPVANFSVACGTELASSVPIAPPKGPADAAGQERQVFASVNAERAQAGLPALVWDDAVAGVARGVADGLSDPSRAATAASSAQVQAALQQAGVASSLVEVNPAQAPSAAEAHQRLLSSPAHRANMLNPDINTGGIGVAIVAGKDGRSTTYLAEVLLKVAARADTNSTASQLVAAIAERRAEAKVPPLKVNPTLQAAAQKYAEELAAAHGDLPESRDEQILAEVRKGYKGSVSMLSGASTVPLDYAKQPKLIASGPDALGVGVAQGDHPKLGRNTYFVVILRGTSR